jgi:hypothetical protein
MLWMLTSRIISRPVARLPLACSIADPSLRDTPVSLIYLSASYYITKLKPKQQDYNIAAKQRGY